MTESAADRLFSLAELRCINGLVEKRCAMGLVIDCSAAYKPNNSPQYVRKIKIVDASLNEDSNVQGITYCTVMFHASVVSELPAPTIVGQVLYLRRFNFNIWNGKFQARRFSSKISSWMLLEGSCHEEEFDKYNSSRSQLNINSERFSQLKSSIRELRNFGSKYLASHSVNRVNKINTSDMDLTLVVKDSMGKDYILTNGAKDYHASLDGVHLIGKVLRVRSISSIENNTLIPNEYTYVLEIEKWMKSYSQLSLLEKSEEDKRFVTLKQLFELPNKGPKDIWNTKVEVIDVLPKNLKEALKYYNALDNKLTTSRTEFSKPVYNIRFLLRDASLPENSVFQAFLFSYDDKGSDFMPQVDITSLDCSSLKKESEEYEKRIQKWTEQSTVAHPVEVVIESCPTKGKLMYRVLRLSW